MKILKIIGLGLLIWSLGLLWPEINLGVVGVFLTRDTRLVTHDCFCVFVANFP